LCLHSSRDEHANAHAYATNDEQELASESINSPGSVEREENTKGSIESVDQRDCVGAGKHLLVDDGAVRVECSLAGDLLATVDNHRNVHAFPDRLVLP